MVGPTGPQQATGGPSGCRGGLAEQGRREESAATLGRIHPCRNSHSFATFTYSERAHIYLLFGRFGRFGPHGSLGYCVHLRDLISKPIQDSYPPGSGPYQCWHIPKYSCGNVVLLPVRTLQTEPAVAEWIGPVPGGASEPQPRRCLPPWRDWTPSTEPCTSRSPSVHLRLSLSVTARQLFPPQWPRSSWSSGVLVPLDGEVDDATPR